VNESQHASSPGGGAAPANVPDPEHPTGQELPRRHSCDPPESLIAKFREAAIRPSSPDVAYRYAELRAAQDKMLRSGSEISISETVHSRAVGGGSVSSSSAHRLRPRRGIGGTRPSLLERQVAALVDASSRHRYTHDPSRDMQALASDRSTSLASTVTESIDVLTGVFASDAVANGRYRLLDFSFIPTIPPAVAQYWSSIGNPESLGRCAGRRVGMSDVAAIQATVDTFRRMDDRYGGGHARMTAVRYLHSEVTPLLKGSYGDKVGRRLFSATADLTQLAGWMAYDIGEHGLAQRYFIQALRLTRTSGDRALGGYILSRMSRQATYLHRPQAAVDLGKAGREAAAALATPTAMALFYAVEARGYGLMGDIRACVSALGHAERHLGLARPGAEPPWSTFFNEAQLSDEFAHCFRDLGRPREAAGFAERSLQLRSNWYARSRAFCRTVLATAYLQQGELDQACHTAGQALQGIGDLRSIRGREYVRDFCSRLAPYRHVRAVRDFCARVDACIGSKETTAGRSAFLAY